MILQDIAKETTRAGLDGYEYNYTRTTAREYHIKYETDP